MKVLTILLLVSIIQAGTHYRYENLNHVENDLFAVSGTDTLTIKSCTLTVNTDIFVNGNGVVNFEADTIILNCNIYAWENAKVKFNACKILWNTTFVYQYGFTLAGAASMIMDSTSMTMPYNAGMNVVDSASFSATASRYSGSWTKAANNRSKMTFVDCIRPFEFLINDSCTVSFTRCTEVLTWLYFPKGSKGTIQLPGDTGFNYLDSFYLGPKSDSLKGITYEIKMDSTTNIWGCIPQAGCDVTIHDSKIRVMGFIFMDSISPYRLSHIDNYTHFTDRLFPLQDRAVRLKNTYVMTFNMYAMLNAEFYLDSSKIGEFISYHNSRSVLKHVTVDGSGGFFGLEGGSRIRTEGCTFTCAVKVKDSSVLDMNYCVAPLTTTVINRGELRASNSYMSMQPDLRDSARYLSVNISSPSNYDTLSKSEPVITSIRNLSAPGAEPYTLTSYAFAASVADSLPLVLCAPAPHTNDTLTMWNTENLSPGIYYLFMPVVFGSGDTLTALQAVVKSATTEEELAGSQGTNGFKALPNPFSTMLTIGFGNAGLVNSELRIDIHDINGRFVKSIAKTTGNSKIVWDGYLGNGYKAAAGIYIVTIRTKAGTVFTKKFYKIN